MIKGRDRKTEREPTPGAEARTVAVVAVMALTIVAGVGVVLLMPRPKPPSPVELARPAPVAPSPLPAWLGQRPEAKAPPQPAAPPPLRERRLETAQVSHAHAAAKPRMITIVRAPERPRIPPPPPSRECVAPASAADRLVCARPELAAQDRALRRAYDRALAAGADRLSVDRAQARWRGQRDRATDERELSRLYARRIAELDDVARSASHRRIYG